MLSYIPGPAVSAMRRRITELTTRPVRFTQLSPRMQHLEAGSEIWPNEIVIALRPDRVDDYILAHEMAHMIIQLESAHLAIDGSLPRASHERNMIGMLSFVL